MKNLELYQFVVQAAVSLIVLSFCLFRLAQPKPSNSALFASMAGSIVGYWLPSPASGRKQSNVSVDSDRTTILASEGVQDEKK